MKKISETKEHEVFLDYFQGQQVRISRSKATGEVFFNSDDSAKVLGFKDHNHMMQDPEVQAEAIEYQQTKGTPMFIQSDNNNHIN